MYDLVSELIVFAGIGRDSILRQMALICRDFEELKKTDGSVPEGPEKEELKRRIYGEIHRILDLATAYGFNGDLWQNYIAFILAMTETPFTLVSEKTGAHEGSVNIFVRHDLRILKEIAEYDFAPIEEALSITCFSVIRHFSAVEKRESISNMSVSEKVRALSRAFAEADTEDQLFSVVTDFYRRYGVGKLGLNKAFRISEDPERELLVPITNTGNMRLDDLVGYEAQKKLLRENTEAFVAGRSANNVLLYGDAGTGKSTSVKAILNEYYDSGLRMIEIYKHQFEYLSKVISLIRNRNYRFIIYMDDLSFEDSELEYKYLKAMIEGGLEPKPENVLIYATSNRRNLVRETWKDRDDQDSEDIHRNDTIQEKLSLSERFGLRIGYFRPSPEEYLLIVRTLAKEHPEIRISEEDLRVQANAWEMKHGGFSGRTARQFVDYLAGVQK